MNDIVNALRTLFDIRFISQKAQAGTIAVRAPRNLLDAATRFLEGLDTARPQVMLDISVYQISHTLTRDMGVHIPNNFNLFNIPAEALVALGGQNIQQLINQLIATGGINQAGSTALSGLLAQLGGQQNPIFQNPLATFGGGLTLMGLSLDTLSATLSLNESAVTALEHVTLRAGQGSDTTFHLGTKLPILNASFAPIFNTPAIAQVIGNQTFQPAFPSVSYEDVGLSLKAKPAVHNRGEVSLALELQLRAVTGTGTNGIPIISNREYKGSINLSNGEPAVVAGAINHTEQRSLSGTPGLGQVPGINRVMAVNGKQQEDDELLVVITPHVLRVPEPDEAEIWLK